MIKAVLFDLDDTLLDINLSAFVVRYLSARIRLFATIARTSPARSAYATTLRAYLAMFNHHRSDNLTNEQIANRAIYKICGLCLSDPLVADAVHTFDTLHTEHLCASKIVNARPQKDARRVVEIAHNSGLIIALATNPTFSKACTYARMKSAHVDDLPFRYVSHAENSTRLKPYARYYEEFAAALGCTCSECLMVGNSISRDFSRPDCGLRTIYVGKRHPRKALWHGSMKELVRAMPDLIERST